MAPLFLLTPATLMWSAPFGTYATTLGLRAAFHRKDMLTKYQSEKPSGSGASADKTQADEVLGVLSRSHANFSEHVPLAMILISLAEMNGAPLALIHSLYGTLLGLRIFHVEFGLKAQGRAGWGRPVGTLGTYAVIVGASLLNLSLSWDYLLSSLSLK